jgi:RHS repeat-associated protein
VLVNARLGPAATTGDGSVAGRWWLFWTASAGERTREVEWQNTAPAGQTWKLYYYAGGRRVAERVLATSADGASSSNTLYYLHGDHLGSTSKVTCGNTACGTVGAVVASQFYYPFGGVRHSSGTLPTDFGFTGQRDDGPSVDLMFYNARYLDTRTGRFASADIIVPGAGNPQAFNRYTYAYNRPLLLVDPTGHYACFDNSSGFMPKADCDAWMEQVLADIGGSGQTGEDLVAFFRALDEQLEGRFNISFWSWGGGMAPPYPGGTIYIPRSAFTTEAGTTNWYDNLGLIAHEIGHHMTTSNRDRITTRSEAMAYQIQGRILADLESQGKGRGPTGPAEQSLTVNVDDWQQLARFQRYLQRQGYDPLSHGIYTLEPTWGVRRDISERLQRYFRQNYVAPPTGAGGYFSPIRPLNHLSY